MESERMVTKVCPMALGISAGFLWAVAVLFFALVSESYGAPIVDFMGHYYIGYKSGLAGGAIGFVWGFFDAGIGMFLFGALYNFLVEKASKCKRTKCCLAGKCKK